MCGALYEEEMGLGELDAGGVEGGRGDGGVRGGGGEGARGCVEVFGPVVEVFGFDGEEGVAAWGGGGLGGGR